ncbi:MAG: hypothetical protein U0176_20560 [Bacteroidia bacterium]
MMGVDKPASRPAVAMEPTTVAPTTGRPVTPPAYTKPTTRPNTPAMNGAMEQHRSSDHPADPMAPPPRPTTAR